MKLDRMQHVLFGLAWGMGEDRISECYAIMYFTLFDLTI